MKAKFLWTACAMVCGLLLVLLNSCQENDKHIAPDGDTGKVVPVGDATGPEVMKEIGASGGQLTSDDGHLTVIVPSGAVTAATRFSIQRISNTNPGGVGEAYRLLPHGGDFQVPVTLRFSYSAMRDSITSGQTVGIAYQDEKQVWYLKSGQANDTLSKTISLRTTHSSDWSFMEFLFIKPPHATLEAGATQNFQAAGCIPKEAVF